MESVSLELAIDRASEVPLGTQLAWRLETAIATGQASPGERLPGVRELADAAGVNVNTARTVYRRLEEQGLIESQHGRGTFVAAGAPCNEDLARIIENAAAAARDAGLDSREVAAALFVREREAAPAPTPAPPPPASGGAQRKRLRGEIAQLEGRLAQLEGLTSTDRPLRASKPGRLLEDSDLEAIRDELRERVSALSAAREQTLDSVLAERRAAAAAELRSTYEQPRRVWRHGGTWTRRLAPGAPKYES